ncbi:MAG: ribonuclease R [Phycisphaerae bacterium]|nr:ribonuclease R [Phycisphaerae bacterium]
MSKVKKTVTEPASSGAAGATPKRLQCKILSGVSLCGYEPMEWQQLADWLGVRKSEFEQFKHEVDELHRSGRLIIGEDKTLRLPGREGTIVGIFRQNSRGFGFVVSSDTSITEDLYIPAQATQGAVTGDMVQARIARRRVKGKMRTYGRIERILTRGKNKFIGTLTKAAKHWMVETDGRVIQKPIIVDDVSAKGVRTGDRVVVQMTEYPVEGQMPRGVILRVLGPAGEPDVELQAVIEEFDLPQEFPETVLDHLEIIIDEFNSNVGKMLTMGHMPDGRLDLRDKLIITIDPATARDFDDAISIDVLDDGYELGVHIADVSAFIPEDSPLDQEARYRGNSVYLPRKVLPMIPEALSNGLCSLQQDQNRLTQSAFIRFDPQGRVQSSRVAQSVIRSTQRLTYEQATAILEGQHDHLPKKVVDLILTAEKLARAIYARRDTEGMLHLDLPEVELEYDEKGQLVDAHPADTSFSHTIIEMFMVEANEAVARLLDSYNIPFLRRIHPDPSKEAFEQLSEFLRMLGHRVPKEPNRNDLQELINRVEGKPESFAVSYAVLRSLQRAEYSPKKIGHFALASTHYCHFTSPIRRYPDLTIHRLLNFHFEGKLKKLVMELRQGQKVLDELGQYCSTTERRAEDAERQITETLILELLKEQIGQHYEGVVTGISGLGPFVQLPKYMIEGLIPINELGEDWWEVNQDGGYILGQRSGKRFKIGDPLKVAIVSADPVSRRLNLTLVEAPAAGAPIKKGKYKKSKKTARTLRSAGKKGNGKKSKNGRKR